MTKYTVLMFEDHEYEAGYVHNFTSESAARTHADNLAKENKGKRVIVEFYRKSDGMMGYINRDGADNVGSSW